MLRLLILATCLVTLLALAVGSTAAKTAVTEVELPKELVAGQRFDVRVTLEDHDGLVKADTPLTVIARSATGQERRAEAVADGDPLRRVATLTLPEEGAWTLTLLADALDFRMELARIDVAVDPAAPASNARLERRISEATSPLERQITALSGEVDQLGTQTAAIDTLTKQVSSLHAERDALAKQIAALQAAQDAAAAERDSSRWPAVLAGAVLGVLVPAGGLAFLARRGRLPLTAPVRASPGGHAP